MYACMVACPVFSGAPEGRCPVPRGGVEAIITRSTLEQGAKTPPKNLGTCRGQGDGAHKLKDEDLPLQA